MLRLLRDHRLHILYLPIASICVFFLLLLLQHSHSLFYDHNAPRASLFPSTHSAFPLPPIILSLLLRWFQDYQLAASRLLVASSCENIPFFQAYRLSFLQSSKLLLAADSLSHLITTAHPPFTTIQKAFSLPILTILQELITWLSVSRALRILRLCYKPHRLPKASRPQRASRRA